MPASSSWKPAGCLFLFAIPFVLGGWFFSSWIPRHDAGRLQTMTATTTGHVVGYNENPTGDGDTWQPQVSFVDSRGATHQVTSSFGSSSAREDWPVGKEITVAYSPDHPDQAEAVDIDAAGSHVFIIAGRIFMVVGLMIWGIAGKAVVRRR